MIIRIENSYGFSIEAGVKSDLKLLDYPDFGCPQAVLKADTIPGRNGEIFRSADIGARDIYLKLESGLPLGILSRVLTPGMEVTVYIDEKWSIGGHITGIRELRKPARLAKPVMTVGIRCSNPFFTRVNSKRQLTFENRGGGIYQGGSYTYTGLTLINEGDVPCPVSVTMCSNTITASALSGLFNKLDWNNGNPIYSGIVFKKGTVSDVQHFVTTDVTSDRFFESYSVLGDCDFFLLPPGKTELFAQNVSGTIEFTPMFLYIDGRDV